MSDDARWVESMPEIYDRCLGPVLFAPFAEHVAAMAAGLDREPALDGPLRVLELAAGTGRATAELVRALPNASITATDLNPAMVAWGSQRITGAVWSTADAQHLDFPNASFDLVVCQFGVMFFPDKRGAFAEVQRVLAPGGVLLCTVWDSAEASAFPSALAASLAAVLPVDPPDFVARVPHGYADAHQIRSDLEAGGLHVRAIERVVLRGRATSAQLVAEGYCVGTPLRFELQRRGEPETLTQQVAAQMTRLLGVGPVEGDLAAIVITATSPPLRDSRP